MKGVSTKKGFSLIELMVALALFAFISVSVVSAMIAVVDGNKRAQATIDALDSLSFAIESMTREMRVGRNFDCAAPVTIGQRGDCVGGAGHIGFTTSEGGFMEYRLNGGQIERRFNVVSGWIAMTGGDVRISNLAFYAEGTEDGGSGDLEQPKIVIVMQGVASSTPGVSLPFRLQTTLAQRFPDF